MKPALEERETVVNYGRLDDTATVYTTDERVMNKLDKFVENSPDWEFVKQETSEGDIVSKTYRCPVSLISFRNRSKKGTMSEEQRRANAERLRNRQARKIQNNSSP